jgi:hypothetical protein
MSKENEVLHELIQQGADKSPKNKHDDTAIRDNHVYEKLDILLNGSPCVTLTGRMRGNTNKLQVCVDLKSLSAGHISFTQACNTPFSGLAADGAKLALWNLTHVGFRIVGFVHDEILIELRLEHGSEINATTNHNLRHQIKMVERIVCSSMQQICGEVPVSCSWFLSNQWSKGYEHPEYNTGGMGFFKLRKIDVLIFPSIQFLDDDVVVILRILHTGTIN